MPAFTAQQQAGIKQDATFDVSARAQQSAYTPFVQALKDNGSTYARSGSNDAGWISFMKEAKLQGVNTVEGLGLLAAVLRQGHPRRAGDRGPVRVDARSCRSTRPRANKMLANFVKYMGADKADGFGAQALGVRHPAP